MSAEAMGLEVHHDDGLDIDFGFGVAQEANVLPAPSHDVAQVEQNREGSKDAGAGSSLAAGTLATTEPAPSEINYDSDVDADQHNEANHTDEFPADANYHEEARADGNHHDDAPAPAVHNNDEITWEDAEDEDTESKSYGIEDSHMSNSPSDPSAVPSQTALSNGNQDLVDNTQGSANGDQGPHDREDEIGAQVGYPEHPEDYEYDLENPGSDAQEPYEESAGDVEGNVDDGRVDEHSSEELDDEPETAEVEDENGDDEMADQTLVVEVDEDDLDSTGELDMVTDIPEVQVLFAGNEYSLFRDPNDADNPYILEDSLFQARASELLDALHDALGDEINDGDELVVQVQELCLEISPMMASTLQSMSISDFAHLHAKLVSNDQPQDRHPLRLTIISKPSFSSRYQELLSGVNQGVGLSQLTRQFDTGQGVLYTSPIKNELGDIEYTNDDMGYDHSCEGEDEDEEDEQEEDEEEEEEEEEGQGEEDDVSKDVSAAGEDEDAHNPPDHADEEAAHDGNVQEGHDGYYGDHFDEGADEDIAYEAEEGQHAASGYENDEFMEDYSGQDGTNTDQQTAREHDEGGLDLDNSYHVPALTTGDMSFEQPAESTARSGPDDDVIDWADDEPANNGTQNQTAHDMNPNMDARASTLQAAPAGTSRNSTPSVTIDGDNEAEAGGVDFHVDIGLAAVEAPALDVDTSAAPPLDEISWEGDDDEGGDGNPSEQPMPASATTANSNGKRQHPGDDSEQNEGDDAIGVKRRRSS